MATPHISLSIRGAKPQENGKAAPEQHADAPRQKEYSEEDLQKAWEGYCQEHPTEKILINTMMAVKPQKIGTDQYLVPVDDNIQVDTFNEAMPSLMQYLRDKLENDSVSLEVKVVQGESSPITWTQAEVLQHMIEERPALLDLIKSFNCSLS